MITGGGTGGHVYPALSIADEIIRRHPNAEILFVGTKRGLESDVVPKAGYEFRSIRVDYFRKKLTVKNIKSASEVLKGFADANRIINDFIPDVIVGTGGYVCGPLVLMGNIKGVKTIIHEQNAIPGKTVKILSKFVDRVLTSFEESHKYFKNKEKLLVTGNPVRHEFTVMDKKVSRDNIAINRNAKMIFSVGGSGGALKVNKIMLNLFEKYNGDDSVQLHHVTGQRYYDPFIEEIRDKGVVLQDNIKVHKYIHNIGDYMAASDLMITRSGALTLTEISTIGVPAILIPSPNVAHNHQEINARVFEKSGAAILVKENNLDVNKLENIISEHLNNEQLLEQMKRNSLGLSKPNAVGLICDEIEKLMKA